MSRLRWISSLGGPMICMEQAVAPSWGGIEALSILSETAANDYERAAEPFGYVQPLPLRKGEALVFGEGLLDTSFWRSSDGKLFIVQIMTCEDNCEPEDVLPSCTQDLSAPEESFKIELTSSPLILFDSVDTGIEIEKFLTADLRPGPYQIESYLHEEPMRCSLILCRFDDIGSD